MIHSYSVLIFFTSLTEFLIWPHKITSLWNYWDTLYKIIIVLKTRVVQKKGNLKGPYQTKCYLFPICTTCSSYCKTQQPQGLTMFFHLGNYILHYFDPTFEIHRGFQCLSWFTKWLLLCRLFSKCLAYWSSKLWKGMCSLSISLLVVRSKGVKDTRTAEANKCPCYCSTLFRLWHEWKINRAIWEMSLL